MIMLSMGNTTITVPNDQGDGITLFDGHDWNVVNTVVDFSQQDLDDIDEAVGVTWGSNAAFTDCVFRGAGKLVLCGSNDSDKRSLEWHKCVTFNHCLFENFGRRGPEVQCGMIVEMNNCLIRNWGDDDRFTVRSFGAWAHDDGVIIANNCVFWQDTMSSSHWLKDKIGHIGQAVNDLGFKGLFTRNAWMSGKRRGLTTDGTGYVEARYCWTNDPGIVLDNWVSEMSDDDAWALINSFQ